MDSAKFRTLAVIDPFAIDPHPGFTQPPGNGVGLDAEGRHRPGVNHVRGGHEDPDVGVDRQYHAVVHLQQTLLAGLDVLVRNHRAVEGEIAMVGILIGPVPLTADGLQRHLGRLDAVHEIEKPERGNGYNSQYHDRDHGPDDLDHGVVGGSRGNRMALGPEPDHHEKQKAGHEQRDDDDDPEQKIVEIVDVRHHRRGRGLKTQLPWFRRTRRYRPAGA